MSVCNNSTSSADAKSDECPIFVITPDILESHILTRLDGVSLAFTSCVSTMFRSLCNNDKLWRDICNSTWPSTTDPRVCSALSSHRSFYYDSFPSIVRFNHQNTDQLGLPEILISAVDIYYGKKVIYSKVMETETRSDRFLNSNFRISVLKRRSVPLPQKFKLNEDKTRIRACAEKHLKISWKLIDRRKNRAVNVAGLIPIEPSLWFMKINGEHEIALTYCTVVADSTGGNMVEFVVLVICFRKGRKLHLKEVSLSVRNMQAYLTGKDSLGILLSAMDGPRRRIDCKTVKAINRDIYLRRIRTRNSWKDAMVLWPFQEKTSSIGNE